MIGYRAWKLYIFVQIIRIYGPRRAAALCGTSPKKFYIPGLKIAETHKSLVTFIGLYNGIGGALIIQDLTLKIGA